MTRRTISLAVFAALTLAACGGGSDDGGSSDGGSGDGGGDAAEQPVPTITSAEICAAVPGEQFVSIVLDSEGAFDTPAENFVGCSYQFFNTESSVLDARVIVENEGGQAGYDAVVTEWSSLGEASEVPAVGDAATLVENGGVRRLIVLDGDRVVVAAGPSSTSFDFTPEVATEMAIATIAVL